MPSEAGTSGRVSCETAERLGERADLEGVTAPRREVEKEATRRELAAVTVISGRAEQIAEGNGTAGDLGPSQANIALALVVRIVDRDQHAPGVAPSERR